MDKKIYTEIVERYADNVYKVALSYCKNQYDSEDVVQTVFLKLFQSNVEYESDEHVKRWLIRVTVNYCKDMMKSFWKKKRVELQEAAGCVGVDFSDNEKSDLYEAVMSLPQKYRIVTHLFYYEDYSIKEIANIIDARETTVQTRLMRARNKLKEILKEGDYDW